MTEPNNSQDIEEEGVSSTMNILDARRHFKQGQKNLRPISGDATRAFYESLLDEKPESAIAIRYCVENGVFGPDKHEELYEKYLKLKEDGAYSIKRKNDELLKIYSQKAED